MFLIVGSVGSTSEKVKQLSGTGMLYGVTLADTKVQFALE
jgi:hypothetical protein